MVSEVGQAARKVFEEVEKGTRKVPAEVGQALDERGERCQPRDNSKRHTGFYRGPLPGFAL